MIHSKDYIPMNCCICGKHMPSIHDTHNPAPITPKCYAKEAQENNLPHRCCSFCDQYFVLPARMGCLDEQMEKYKEIIKEYINKKPFKLSRASLEVLGIISKKQPVTKQEIDKIRGVDSTGVINVLLERELINVSGEKNVPGRPFLYKTTEMFLEVFSLKDINDIPDLEEFEEYEKNKI